MIMLWMAIYNLHHENEYTQRNIDTQRQRVDRLEGVVFQ